MQSDRITDRAEPTRSNEVDDGTAAGVETLLGALEELADDVESPETLAEIRETKRSLAMASADSSDPSFAGSVPGTPRRRSSGA